MAISLDLMLVEAKGLPVGYRGRRGLDELDDDGGGAGGNGDQCRASRSQLAVFDAQPWSLRVRKETARCPAPALYQGDDRQASARVLTSMGGEQDPMDGLGAFRGPRLDEPRRTLTAMLVGRTFFRGVLGPLEDHPSRSAATDGLARAAVCPFTQLDDRPGRDRQAGEALCAPCRF